MEDSHYPAKWKKDNSASYPVYKNHRNDICGRYIPSLSFKPQILDLEYYLNMIPTIEMRVSRVYIPSAHCAHQEVTMERTPLSYPNAVLVKSQFMHPT